MLSELTKGLEESCKLGHSRRGEVDLPGRLTIHPLLAENWEEAAKLRLELLKGMQDLTGVGTLLDYRRSKDYDSEKLVDRYLNQQHVKVQPFCQK